MFKSAFNKLSQDLNEMSQKLQLISPKGYNKKELEILFPEFSDQIANLSEIVIPSSLDLTELKKSLHTFLEAVETTSLPIYMKTILKERGNDLLLYSNMIEHYGTPFYYELSKRLYGSSLQYKNKDALSYFFDEISNLLPKDDHKTCKESDEITHFVTNKFNAFFKENLFEIEFHPLISDIKIKDGRLYFPISDNRPLSDLEAILTRDLWVKLAAKLNSEKTEDNYWLTSWAPRASILSEGLATLTQILSSHLTQDRWQEMILKYLASCMAENGSSIKEVYAFLRHGDLSEVKAFEYSLDIFNGVPFEGGMCSTRELLPIHGLIKLLKHLQFFNPTLKSFWLGNMSLEEHSLLHHHTNALLSEISYFPDELNTASAYEKLEELRILTLKALRNDF